MRKPSLPRGTRDFGPEQSIKRKYIIDTIESKFQKYGFNKIETPALESLDVLTGKYGEEGDQLLFKILNSGDFLKKAENKDFDKGSKSLLPKISEKGLRYDLTVPFARHVVMNQHDITFPFKRYQIQPVWRADRPARGRYREFYQCDADVIGTKSIWNEVELTILIHDIFSSLNLNDFRLKINHREVLYALAEKVGMNGKENAFCVELDKIDKIGGDEVLKNLVKIGSDKSRTEQVLKFIQASGSNRLIIDEIAKVIGEDNHGVHQLIDYLDLLESTGESFQLDIDFSLARGLSYYTGLIFEVKPTKVRMGSICGGGRYDDLTGVFGLSDVSGIGISFGLDRIYDVLEEQNLFPKNKLNTISLFITHFDEMSFKHGLTMLGTLRRKGINSDIYPEVSKLKKQLNYANKIQVPFVVTIGDREMETGNYAFKDMISGDQSHKTIAEIVDYLSSTD